MSPVKSVVDGAPIPMPGKRRNDRRVREMIRVDHAGEYGAVAIYQGQRAVFKNLPHKSRIASQLEEMEADEQHHLDAFDGLIRKGRSRPTALSPYWQIGGRVLGTVTALMGERAAHACTEAVETVIEGHYARQVEELRVMGEDELADMFDAFREEEVAHKDLAVDEGARDAAGYPVLSAVIKAGCHTAIRIAEKI